MDREQLLREIAAGEDSSHQFKRDVHNAQSLAAEMAAFANTRGGTIYIGVSDDGVPVGLDSPTVSRVNQLIANAASQLVRSPLSVRTENVLVADDRVVIAVSVPDGWDKPYFDNTGVIWLKSGSDKRRINSKEELRRMFQTTDQIHGDEMPTKADVADLDLLRFRPFVEQTYGWDVPDQAPGVVRLLKNLTLATETGHLNLAGLLLFGRNPQRYRPQFEIKAVWYPGITPHPEEYLDGEDFVGPVPTLFEGALTFVMRTLHKVQGAGGVNSPGTPEVPRLVLEELLVNAIVHRDYLVDAPIRVFVYDDRIEIVSPGHLPNNLTVDNVLSGISNIRNPILASFAAKGLLPYRGLGSGIVRALAAWSDITLDDDRDGNQFVAVINRPRLR